MQITDITKKNHVMLTIAW